MKAVSLLRAAGIMTTAADVVVMLDGDYDFESGEYEVSAIELDHPDSPERLVLHIRKS